MNPGRKLDEPVFGQDTMTFLVGNYVGAAATNLAASAIMPNAPAMTCLRRFARCNMVGTAAVGMAMSVTNLAVYAAQNASAEKAPKPPKA